MFDYTKMSKEDLPRERLEKYGVSALTSSELLSIILSTGTKNKSVLCLSNELLQEAGDLNKLAVFGFNEFMQIKGIGKVKAGKLLAIFEIAKRYNSLENARKLVLNKPDRVYDYMCSKYMGENRECVYTLSLDSKNQLISADLVSIGTVNCSLAHPREIFRYAIKNSAVSIILVHNHPSGNVEPSQADIELTDKVSDSGNIIGIKLLDHVIVAASNYYSMKENGYI